ncbi:glutamate racemase [Granulicella aggregans]|uniref:Glutamate racemase n=1 Tax=Granulicella aggregans TaxID=474949 RepID=A0A7W7ZGZ9_9BACT|nr:glutamate racemase [Granulicella aggregans]MBB5059755.1 glutamate racemase [Granulicella aggregans]
MSQFSSARRLKVGVFDSGFGGLTVLRELLKLLPEADSIYLGDTARLPYGSKSQKTISRYAVESSRFLADQGSDLLVIACNTATAMALPDIQEAMTIPVVGVIEPGAKAALATGAGDVLVLATAATVQSGAYTAELNALGLKAYEKACPLLVPLVEEGWTSHHVMDEVLKIYLSEALAQAPDSAALLLGCTHYPLIQAAIREAAERLGHPMEIVDSARATAMATAEMIAARFGNVAGHLSGVAKLEFYATDSVEKFQRLGAGFLGQPIDEVRLIDLGG